MMEIGCGTARETFSESRGFWDLIALSVSLRKLVSCSGNPCPERIVWCIAADEGKRGSEDGVGGMHAPAEGAVSPCGNPQAYFR